MKNRFCRTSISVKMVITMLLIVIGTIGLCWFINNTFLEKYYIHHKQEQILNGFETIDYASQKH